MKKKDIYIDADYLIFEVTEGKATKGSFFKGNDEGSVEGGDYKQKLKPYKKKLKALVKDIENEIAVNFPGEIGETHVIFSDPDSNFRYNLYPEYKANRDSGARSKLFYRLRKWALKKYVYVKNMEADDVVSHYVRKGNIGASFDKDMLKGVAGIWFDTYHTRRHIIERNEVEARCFNYLQTLMGDPTDNIKGIPRVGEKTAIKLLDEFGWNWDGVLKAYESKGLTVDDMELNARLILLNQWSPKKGLCLFKFKDVKLSKSNKIKD